MFQYDAATATATAAFKIENACTAIQMGSKAPQLNTLMHYLSIACFTSFSPHTILGVRATFATTTETHNIIPRSARSN